MIGARHGDDVPFFMGHPFILPQEYDQSDIDLSMNMMRSLASFARNGKPAFENDIIWPSFNIDKKMMVLDPENTRTIDSNNFRNGYYYRFKIHYQIGGDKVALLRVVV